MRSPLPGRPRSRAPAALTALAATILTTGFVAVAQTRPAAPARTMPVDELRTGMRGYGLTVFRGVTPERFEVEIVDVLHDFRAQQDLVLIRPTHPVIERANTIGGMSGSPIYIDDRLVGAYAYGWEYGSETIAGVTPIANMLAETRRTRRAPAGLLPGSQVPIPVGDTPAPSARPRAGVGPRLRASSAYERAVEAMRLSRAPVPTARGSFAPISVPMSVAGMGPRALAQLTTSLEPFGIEPLQAGGGGGSRVGAPPPGTPEHFVNGGSVSVEFISGDISASGAGTVTLAGDGAALAFGHPMLGLGETLIPTAVSRVAWVMASLRRSVKLTEPVRMLGALVQDRPSTIIVDERATAPTMPMRVHVTGNDPSARSEWNVRIAYNRQMLVRLTASVVGTVLETVAGDHGDAAWSVHSVLHTRDHGDIRLNDFGTSAEGTGAVTPASLLLLECLDRLTDNPFEQVRVERIDTEVELRWARDFYMVRSAALSRAEADPGDTVDLLVTLARYGGQPEVRRVPIRVPRELAGRDMDIEISGGNDTSPDLPEPESVGDLIRNYTSGFPEDSLVVSQRLPGQGVTLRGRTVHELPGSALDALRPAASTDGGDPIVNMRRTVVPLGRIVVGRDRVRLRVREVRQ